MSTSDSDDNTRLRKKCNTNKQKNNSCSKLCLTDHFAAFMEERALDRDIEALECDKEMMEIIFNNYVIVKNILSHLHWQEKWMCKAVCQLWKSAVDRLQYEQLGPVDFSINLSVRAVRKRAIEFLKSSEFYTKPLAVFVFCNTVDLNVCIIGCKDIRPSPCPPICEEKHSLIDIIYQETSAPINCLFGIKDATISYLPLPQSRTNKNSLRKLINKTEEFVCGLYIPKIPGVKFHMIDINSAEGIERELIPELKRLAETYIVKGIIACLTDNYLLSHMDEESSQALEFLNAMQPNIPFALGGCLVEDTGNIANEIYSIIESVNQGQEYISGNTMSLGLFLIPKMASDDIEGPKSNFEIYSCVIEAAEWSKKKIKQAIQEFSERVPRFEHSVAFKFSCTGREQKHETEQNCFRTFFPNTPLAGCLGNGELGVNLPRRKHRPVDTKPTKRPREQHSYDKVHSYSTVFFYIGWGKITEEAERDD